MSYIIELKYITFIIVGYTPYVQIANKRVGTRVPTLLFALFLIFFNFIYKLALNYFFLNMLLYSLMQICSMIIHYYTSRYIKNIFYLLKYINYILNDIQQVVFYLDLEARPTDFQIEERFLRSAVDKFHARRYSQKYVSAINS